MKAIIGIVVLGLLLFGCLGPAEGQCGDERSYVCGSDGNTYMNACYAGQAGVQIAYEGQCVRQNVTSMDCVDSDSGKNALEYGMITKGESAYNDSCASTTAVFEYYCTDNEIRSERVSCPEGTECSGGKCAAPSCTDSDGGQVAGVSGTVGKGAESHPDECADDSTVKEYYCSGNSVADTLLTCPAGTVCVSGACSASACTDTDGGFEIYERGTVREGGGVYTDYCSGTSSVKEYYCSGADMVQAIGNCGDGFYCSDGRCLEYTCRDDDGGRDEDEFGTVTKGSDEWEDECYDGDTVTEYYCDGNTVSDTRISCGSSELCQGGECVRVSCSDTDGGKVRAVAGTTSSGGSSSSDYCLEVYNLREYLCSGPNIVFEDILCTAYGEMCYRNVCSPAYCDDSDGGRDEHISGSVMVYTDNGYSDSGDDRCIDTRTVGEKYCSDLKISEARMACAADEVCSGGRCIEAVCTDSDGGKNWIVPGTTSKGADSATDYCDPMDPVDLYEYYCSGNEIHYEVHACPDGCVENAEGIGYCNPL